MGGLAVEEGLKKDVSAWDHAGRMCSQQLKVKDMDCKCQRHSWKRRKTLNDSYFLAVNLLKSSYNQDSMVLA